MTRIVDRPAAAALAMLLAASAALASPGSLLAPRPVRSTHPIPGSQLATRNSQLSPEFDLIAAALAELRGGREEDAKRRAAAAPHLARRAFEELMADAVVSRVQSGAALDPAQTRLLELLAAA